MTPTQIKNCNLLLSKPSDMTDEECGELWAKHDKVNGIYQTAWVPNELELAQLKQGHAVILHVWSKGHPPVALTVSGERYAP